MRYTFFLILVFSFACESKPTRLPRQPVPAKDYFSETDPASLESFLLLNDELMQCLRHEAIINSEAATPKRLDIVIEGEIIDGNLRKRKYVRTSRSSERCLDAAFDHAKFPSSGPFRWQVTGPGGASSRSKPFQFPEAETKKYE